MTRHVGPHPRRRRREGDAGRAARVCSRREGYQVETASSGEEALRRIETGSFHLVITDLSMKGIDGMQVLEHARGVDPDVAVVMITAHGSEKIAGRRR